MDKIKVSVWCTTYNHENYVRDALEGFVMQETEYPFEVIVHDDASTDRTRVIIEEYANRYPDIIKPILETENQYRIGTFKRINSIMLAATRGSYIAECEGDDYWESRHKLQKQIQFLEQNGDYAACVHNTREADQRNGRERMVNTAPGDYDIPFHEIIMKGGAAYHTSSAVYRKELADVAYSDRAPAFFDDIDFSDYPLAVYLSCSGKIRYLAEVMSVYRKFADGSWTSTNKAASSDRRIQHDRSVVQMLARIDAYTEGRYAGEIRNAADGAKMEILLNYGSKLKTDAAACAEYFKCLSAAGKRKAMGEVFRRLFTKQE